MAKHAIIPNGDRRYVEAASGVGAAWRCLRDYWNVGIVRGQRATAIYWTNRADFLACFPGNIPGYVERRIVPCFDSLFFSNSPSSCWLSVCAYPKNILGNDDHRAATEGMLKPTSMLSIKEPVSLVGEGVGRSTCLNWSALDRFLRAGLSIHLRTRPFAVGHSSLRT